MPAPTQIEKKSLEAHVEICAVRYANLETKLENLEHRMDKLENHIVGLKESITSHLDGQDKQTVKILITVLGVALTGLIGFITHAIFG